MHTRLHFGSLSSLSVASLNLKGHCHGNVKFCGKFVPQWICLFANYFLERLLYIVGHRTEREKRN